MVGVGRVRSLHQCIEGSTSYTTQRSARSPRMSARGAAEKDPRKGIADFMYACAPAARDGSATAASSRRSVSSSALTRPEQPRDRRRPACRSGAGLPSHTHRSGRSNRQPAIEKLSEPYGRSDVHRARGRRLSLYAKAVKRYSPTGMVTRSVMANGCVRRSNCGPRS